MITLETIARRCAGTIRRLPVGRRLARRMRRRAASILMYHGVTQGALAVPNWCQVSAREFERQIDHLAAEHQVLSLSEVVARLEGGRRLPDHTACITFDDGFRNVFTTAVPILRRKGLPATVFLVTENLETGQPAWPDRLFYNLAQTAQACIAYRGRQWPLASAPQRWAAYRGISGDLKTIDNETRQVRVAALIDQLGGHDVPRDSALAPMDWDEVEQLSAGGAIEFGSHTHTHPILSRCGLPRQYEELRRSRAILEERLGRVDWFAYPNGSRRDFTTKTQRLLRELGYRGAVTTIPGLNRRGSDCFALRRIGVGSDTTMTGFEQLVLGF
jgi:peptidoglycan/xylan/chitin deacetylase (PgdA/CDA1 family)